jgi:hypothetical protein
MLTKERAKILADLAKSDKKWAEKIYALEIEEAFEQIQASGHNFTLDEIKEFAENEAAGGIAAASSVVV